MYIAARTRVSTGCWYKINEYDISYWLFQKNKIFIIYSIFYLFDQWFIYDIKNVLYNDFVESKIEYVDWGYLIESVCVDAKKIVKLTIVS